MKILGGRDPHSCHKWRLCCWLPCSARWSCGDLYLGSSGRCVPRRRCRLRQLFCRRPRRPGGRPWKPLDAAWHRVCLTASRTRYVVSDVTHSSQLTPCSVQATATPQTRKAPPIEALPKSEISEYWKSFIHHTHGSIVIQQIRYKNNLI